MLSNNQCSSCDSVSHSCGSGCLCGEVQTEKVEKSHVCESHTVPCTHYLCVKQYWSGE